MAASLAGRQKVLLDPKAGGRRHVWLADPERFGVGLVPAAPEPPRVVEPDD
jgi:Cu+-exporting ATPase